MSEESIPVRYLSGVLSVRARVLQFVVPCPHNGHLASTNRLRKLTVVPQVPEV